jgi:hypothetical protein
MRGCKLEVVKLKIEVTPSSGIFQTKIALVVFMWLSLVSLICFKPAIDVFTLVQSRTLVYCDMTLRHWVTVPRLF